MNILKLQDMLKGLPDARLKQELDNPNGSVPQYLVLSEVVRRQKMREEFKTPNEPQTTVLDDMKNMLTPRPPMPQPMPQMPQQPPAAMAEGGFVSPAEAFGNAGFSGRPMQPQMKPQPPMGSLSGPINLSPQTMAPQQSYQPQQQPVSAQQAPMVQLQQYGQLGQPDTQQQPEQAFAYGGPVRMSDGGLFDWMKINKAEGSGRNPKSSASGYGQFLEGTWMEYVKQNHPELLDSMSREQILNLRNNEGFGKEATQWYQTSVVQPELERAGLPVTKGTLYLGHFAGPGGARAVLAADPNASVSSILGDKVVQANPFLKDMNAAQLIAWADKKMGGDSSVSGMAGRETTRGVGQGAGGEAVGFNYDPAKNEGGIGTVPEDQSMWSKFAKNLASGATDMGDAILSRQQHYAPSGGMMRGQAPSNYGKNELDLVNAYKKAAMTGADASGQTDAINYFPRYGILALADGGTVYLKDGTENPDVVDPYVTLGLDRNDPAIKDMKWWQFRDAVKLTPERMSQMTPEQVKQWNEARDKIRDEKLHNNNFLFRTLQEVPPAVQKTIDESRTGGMLQPFTSYETQVEAAKRLSGVKPIDGPSDKATEWTAPNPDDVASGAFAEKTLGPSTAPEAKKEPGILDLYKQYMDQSLKVQRDYIDEQRRAAEEARGGGMGQLLRRLGIGVLSSPSGRFGDMLASGVTNVSSAEDKARQQYLDRISQIRDAELKYGTEAAKIPYELAAMKQKLAGGMTAGDIRDFYGERLKALDETEKELIKAGVAADQNEIAKVRAEKARVLELLMSYGLPVPPPVAPTAIPGDAKSALGIK